MVAAPCWCPRPRAGGARGLGTRRPALGCVTGARCSREGAHGPGAERSCDAQLFCTSTPCLVFTLLLPDTPSTRRVMPLAVMGAPEAPSYSEVRCSMRSQG